MDPSAARTQNTAHWNAYPCGAVPGDPNSIEYFTAVERERYRQQAWQHDFFDFASFEGRRVLEIGVGQGTDLAQFANAGADCHGIDITDAHLERSRRNFQLRRLPVTLRKADATSLPYPDGYFDVVYSFGVLHHLPDIQDSIGEIRRVLRPGGTLMLALYRKWSFFHLYMLVVRGILQGHLFRLGYAGLLSTIESGADGREHKPYVKLYSRQEIRDLLRAFEIERLEVRQLFLGRFEHPSIRPALRVFEPLLGWYFAVRACNK